MQGNLITTILALVLYLASGLFGGNKSPSISPDNIANLNPQINSLPNSGTISVSKANLRKLPSSTGEIISTLNKGTRVEIMSQKEEWYQVAASGATIGWISKWLINQSTPSFNNTQKIIAGYYVENYYNDPVGYKSLSQNLTTINTIIPFSFKVDQYGTITGTHNSKPNTLTQSAGGDSLALVNNISGGNFNSNAIHRMLSSATARSKAVNGISRLLREKGYQGVNIDFENIPAWDRIYLTAFFKELASVLRSQNLLITASLPAKTMDDKKSSHSGAFDYESLAPYLDQAMIMTYDEHYTNGPAGPVASYPWVEKVIQYTKRFFPSSKIVLGLAAYGYDWGLNSGKALNYNKIQTLIAKQKVFSKWHSVYKVPYFTYKSWGITHQVWYENSYSTASKMELVRKYGLRGVAVWRLGYEDPGIWNAIQRGF